MSEPAGYRGQAAVRWGFCGVLNLSKKRLFLEA